MLLFTMQGESDCRSNHLIENSPVNHDGVDVSSGVAFPMCIVPSIPAPCEVLVCTIPCLRVFNKQIPNEPRSAHKAGAKVLLTGGMSKCGQTSFALIHTFCLAYFWNSYILSYIFLEFIHFVCIFLEFIHFVLHISGIPIFCLVCF